MNGKLAASIEFAREAMSLRVGHEVEIAALETVDREGHANLRVYWRDMRPALRIVNEVKSGSGGKLDPSVVASRVGSEFGLHTLFFDSPDDLIEISHRARGREGFGRGAVLAAELIRGRKGLIRFDELVMS